MLTNENVFFTFKNFNTMNQIETEINYAKSGLDELRRVAHTLKTGLENVAVVSSERATLPNQSIVYLGAAEESFASALEAMKNTLNAPMITSKELGQALALVKVAGENDQALRQKYKINEKFRFIRDKLAALISHVEQAVQKLTVPVKEIRRKEDALEPNETLVYVYVFNAQGANLKSWQNLLNRKAFYEYSINRSIYQDQKEIEDYLKNTKTNKMQNGYLAVVIDKEDTITQMPITKGSLQYTLLKVREGSLKLENLAFLHTNETNYILDDEGQLIIQRKKSPTPS